MEWLQWDVTVGMSINAALAAYSPAGWRLAANTEMANLLNAFDLGYTFGSDENTGYGGGTAITTEASPLTEHDVQFITLFGVTYVPPPTHPSANDLQISSWAGFGTDADNDGMYNVARVTDDFTVYPNYYPYPGYATIQADAFGRSGDYWDNASGVALVRIPAVPLPAAAWLFGSALLGLVATARRRQAA
ncbi:MAG: VPLPA-CTERM sorting domain-containing protein [Pseudomonadales bacterium]|nr:VPLPA-CTERM sorting domain-containing protein [Pseudomonadales bacterium]